MEVEDSSAGADFDITPRADNSIESTDVDDREAPPESDDWSDAIPATTTSSLFLVR